MRKFDPTLCRPYLKKVIDDEYFPSAMSLTYIAGLEIIMLDNYMPQGVSNFLDGIRKIHRALARHRVRKQPNMMIVKDSPDRVVWLDFDRARTYDKDQITAEEEILVKKEAIVMELKDAIAVDAEKRKLDETYLFYFGS